MSSLKLVLRVPKDEQEPNSNSNINHEDDESSQDDQDYENFVSENSNSYQVGRSSINDDASLLNFASLDAKRNASNEKSKISEIFNEFQKLSDYLKFIYRKTARNEDEIKAKPIFKDNVDNLEEPEKQKKSPFDTLLDYMLDYLERKDPENYFKQPVSDEIAPNYSEIIEKPMDFITLRKNVEQRADLKLIYQNAITYNQPGSVHYVAAERLKVIIDFLFSREKLLHMLKTQSFMSRIPAALLSCDLLKTRPLKEKKSKFKSSHYACIVDDMSPDDVFVQANSAAIAAKEKLAARKPTVGYVNNVKKDGTTTLNFLMPEHFSDARNENCKEKVFTLGDILPKLREGTPGLHQIRKDPSNVAIPHAPLEYGEFASFAPYFDSTWSTLSKEESKILLNYLNDDKKSVDYIDSLRRFTRNTSDYMTNMVDGILDVLTQGDYSKLLKDNTEVHKPLEDQFDNIQDSFEVVPENSNVVGNFSTKIDEILAKNCSLLSDLQTLQFERLSQPPPLVLTDAVGPSDSEIKVADQVLTNLQNLASQARLYFPFRTERNGMQSVERNRTKGKFLFPSARLEVIVGRLCSYPFRSKTIPRNLLPSTPLASVLGVSKTPARESNDSEECDMEVFKEFFQGDSSKSAFINREVDQREIMTKILESSVPFINEFGFSRATLSAGWLQI
uniref:Bromo domain-containing protein n=1 Tax=Romanomermis culicivorax TaxID=13658 RepID=A0A915HX39_ROMCU